MPSSISNSRHPAFTYAKILFAICASLTISFELLSDDLLKHHSETYARVSQQYADALLRNARIGFGMMFEQIIAQQLKGDGKGRTNGEQDLGVSECRVPRIGNRRRH